MGKVRIELNSKGMRELLNDQGVRDDLTRRANTVAGSVPQATVIQETHGPRAVVRVRAGLREEADTGQLARAIGRAR